MDERSVHDFIPDGDALVLLKRQLESTNRIDTDNFIRFNVKKGLRNADGTGVMAGLTRVCNVEGYYINDGEKVPKKGQLFYRGVDVNDLVEACRKENRFGYEEVVWLLLFGELPTADALEKFTGMLGEMRDLPENFTEDMIMKAPSKNIMNKMARSVSAMYSYDTNPDDTSLENVLRQSLWLVASMPSMMSYAYQVKRRAFYKKSMYLHPTKPEHHTAEAILNYLRSDKKFTDEEAKLLDLCLMLHAEHGGGNNSTFAVRVLSSSGTDTYSSIAAGIGALKGPKHGGANLKVAEMVNMIRENVSDITDESQVEDYLAKIIRGEGGDGTGLVYGMGHAVYTLSDPRAVILRREAQSFSRGTEFEDDFRLLSIIEEKTPELLADIKHNKKTMCANVDLYSGLIYRMLRIPEDLYTPLFATARIAGWSAHRMEELYTGGRIIRPAYKSLAPHVVYVPIEQRKAEKAK